jgi:hypothetical protein
MTDINVSLLQNLAKQTGGEFYRVLWKESFESFFDEIVEDVFVHQQEKIQYTFWELNIYLIYVIVFALFGLLCVKIYVLVSSWKRS